MNFATLAIRMQALAGMHAPAVLANMAAPTLAEIHAFNNYAQALYDNCYKTGGGAFNVNLNRLGGWHAQVRNSIIRAAGETIPGSYNIQLQGGAAPIACAAANATGLLGGAMVAAPHGYLWFRPAAGPPAGMWRVYINPKRQWVLPVLRLLLGSNQRFKIATQHRFGQRVDRIVVYRVANPFLLCTTIDTALRIGRNSRRCYPFGQCVNNNAGNRSLWGASYCENPQISRVMVVLASELDSVVLWLFLLQVR